MQKKKLSDKPVIGAGVNPAGLFLAFLAMSLFLWIGVFVLSSAFRSDRPASSAHSAKAEIKDPVEASTYTTGESQIDIQPFDVYCKKALARAPGEGTPLPHIDLPGMVQSIYDRKFSFLELAFVDCQKAYEDGRITDHEIDHAHQIFTNSDPRIDSLLSEWIGLYPDTPFSWLARARHRRSLAEYARGGKWARDTPESNFRKMNYLLTMAQQDYAQAIDLNPRISFAYTGMMYAAGNTSDQGFVHALFAKGLQNNPDSINLWHTLLHEAQPKWGGSLEEMDKVLAGASRTLKNPDDLRGLKVNYYKYKGDHAAQIEKDETAADVFYKLMFEHMGPFAQYRYLAGKEKTWKSSFPYYKKALALEPFDVKALRGVSRGFLVMGEPEKALIYADVAVFLDAMAPDSLRLRGEIHENMRNFDAAIADYKNSLIYDPEHYFANMHLGHLLDAIKGRPEEAAPYLMQALLSDPENASAIYILGLNEETRKDCNALKSAAALLHACTRLSKDKACAPHSLNWARTVGKRMRSAGLCPQK
ncbi:MAG: DUF4034 domain-containing protein [Rhodospirillales bacterium]|nr:DUF4034 domain-containing protein [Rhodospirillales bacterium]